MKALPGSKRRFQRVTRSDGRAGCPGFGRPQIIVAGEQGQRRGQQAPKDDLVKPE